VVGRVFEAGTLKVLVDRILVVVVIEAVTDGTEHHVLARYNSTEAGVIRQMLNLI
jgi:hypothetical protein